MRATRAGALAAAVCLALLAGCGADTSEEVEATAPVPVAVRVARRGPIHGIVQATGVVRPAVGAELVVIAPETARIAALPHGPGERVRRGDLLVRFDIPSLAADAAARSSDVERAEARLAQARAGFTRVSDLFGRGIAARREVEDARRELTEAEAGVGEAKSARAAARSLAGRETVRAPFDGVVAEVAHNPGDLVEPSAGDAVLRLIDPRRLQVEAAVPFDQLSAIAVGHRASVQGPGAAPPEEAVVIARPAAVDPATAAGTVRLAFTQGTRLPAGAPVRIEVFGAEHPDAVLAPAAAVVQEGPETFLYTVDAQGKAHRRAVRLGLASGGEVEVLAGLAAGERVVVEGQNGLPDGAAVVAGAEPPL